MARRYLSAEQFKGEAKAEADTADVVVAMPVETEIKAATGEERALDFVISTDDVDRQGDRVSVEGWQLGNFRKNPVVLWAHDYASLPVAKAQNVRVEDGKLKARAVFTPLGMAKFNDIIFEMLKGGFLSAVSVGFQPRKWAWAEDAGRAFGIDFQEQELLEFSVVPVPANASALIEARAKGIDVEPIVEFWRKTLQLPPDFEMISAAELAELRANDAAFKAQRSQPPAPARPRLTARALDLARLRGAC